MCCFKKRFNVWFLILRSQSQTLLLSTYLTSPFVTLEKRCLIVVLLVTRDRAVYYEEASTILPFLSASYASPCVFLDLSNPWHANCLLKPNANFPFHSPAIAPWTRQQYYYRSHLWWSPDALSLPSPLPGAAKSEPNSYSIFCRFELKSVRHCHKKSPVFFASS